MSPWLLLLQAWLRMGSVTSILLLQAGDLNGISSDLWSAKELVQYQKLAFPWFIYGSVGSKDVEILHGRVPKREKRKEVQLNFQRTNIKTPETIQSSKKHFESQVSNHFQNNESLNDLHDSNIKLLLVTDGSTKDKLHDTNKATSVNEDNNRDNVGNYTSDSLPIIKTTELDTQFHRKNLPNVRQANTQVQTDGNVTDNDVERTLLRNTKDETTNNMNKSVFNDTESKPKSSLMNTFDQIFSNNELRTTKHDVRVRRNSTSDGESHGNPRKGARRHAKNKRIHLCGYIRRLGYPIGTCVRKLKTKIRKPIKNGYDYLMPFWPLHMILGGGVG